MKKTLVFLVSTALLLGTISGPRALPGMAATAASARRTPSDAGLCDTLLPRGAGCTSAIICRTMGRLHFYGWLNAGFSATRPVPPASSTDPTTRWTAPMNPCSIRATWLAKSVCPGRFVGVGRSRQRAVRRGLLAGPEPRLGTRIPTAHLAGTAASTTDWRCRKPTSRWADRSVVEDRPLLLAVGYEGVLAPGNFFYSKSYSYQFAGPFQHWGGLVTWQAMDPGKCKLGLHNGWNALDRVSDHMGVIAGIKYTNPCRDWWSSFA